ncbi:MAG TPA: hypothetical protein VG457_05665, partial [Planctomycetota bacterium]|nr:hypothetical protein [Planctomycetota bacterium]
MSQVSKILTRRTALLAGVCLVLGASGVAHAGIPKTPRGNQSANGPYGLPSLKKVTEACSLTHDEEEAVLRVYNEYKHKEHEEMQAKEKSTSSGRSDCINAVKQVLTPDQQKKFDELLSDGKKKKKT